MNRYWAWLGVLSMVLARREVVFTEGLIDVDLISSLLYCLSAMILVRLTRAGNTGPKGVL